MPEIFLNQKLKFKSSIYPNDLLFQNDHQYLIQIHFCIQNNFFRLTIMLIISKAKSNLFLVNSSHMKFNCLNTQ